MREWFPMAGALGARSPPSPLLWTEITRSSCCAPMHTCYMYMNAVLQALYMNRSFRRGIFA